MEDVKNLNDRELLELTLQTIRVTNNNLLKVHSLIEDLQSDLNGVNLTNLAKLDEKLKDIKRKIGA